MEPDVSLPCSQKTVSFPFLSHMSIMHTFPSYFYNTHFNIIILLSTTAATVGSNPTGGTDVCLLCV
jgi:hypothetical protein